MQVLIVNMATRKGYMGPWRVLIDGKLVTENGKPKNYARRTDIPPEWRVINDRR